MSAHGTEKEPDLVVPWVGTGSGFLVSCAQLHFLSVAAVWVTGHTSPCCRRCSAPPFGCESLHPALESAWGLLVLFMPAPDQEGEPTGEFMPDLHSPP